MSQIGKYVPGTGGTPVLELITSDGVNVGADLLGDINILNGNNITTTGNAVTNTVYIAVAGTTDHAIQVGNATGSLTSLGTGNAGQILQSNGAADPIWTTTLYPSTSAIGDVIYASAANTLVALAFDNTATRYLSNTGGGATIPAWTQIDLTNGVTGTLPIGNGGTGATTFTDHSLLCGSGVGAITAIGAATNGQIPIGSTGADPVLATPTNGNNITWTGGAGTLRADVTGTTDHCVQVGNATGNLTSLAAATNGQLVIGSTGADPVLATLTAGTGVTITNAAGSITINAGGVDQSNIIYVGKHGNDANDGLTIEKAKLTFSAAITAAFIIAPAVVSCADEGTYTENLTGQIGVCIWAPNATIAGAHTLGAGNSWTFESATVADGVIGFTYNDGGNNSYLTVTNIVCSGSGIAVLCLAGNMHIRCYNATITTGYFIGSATTGEINVRIGSLNITGAGTAFGVSAVADIAVLANHISCSGAGTLIYSTAGALTTIDITASHINIQNLSNITANVSAVINAASLEGTLAEIGAGTIDRIGGSTRIDGIPIGAQIRSTGDFTTITTTNPIGAAYGGTGIASPADHSLLVGSGAAAMTELGVATNGQIPIGSTGADPVLAAPTNGTNITWTGGAGTLQADLTATIAVVLGGTGATTLTDHATLLGSGAGAITPVGPGASGQLLIGSNGADPVWAALGSTGGTITYTAGAGTLNLEVANPGVAWGIQTVDLNPMVNGHGYIANKAGLLTFTLPTTAAVGTVLRVTGMNTDIGWRIAQSANQQVHFGNLSTTIGAGGYLESTHKRDSVELVCVVADLEWNVVSGLGNVTIV